MSAKNNETTTKFKVDISDLKSAMQEAKRQVALANSEFKSVSSTMDNWADSAEGISAKLKQLKSNLSSQKSVLTEYEKILAKVKSEYGENSKEAQIWETKVNNQKATVNQTEKEIEKLRGGVDNLTKSTKESGDGFTVFKGVLANLATEGIKLAVDGVKKLGSAMGNMVKESVSAYADAEQLVGGVETLFKGSAKKVVNYANNAYKTAGMSANDYMETVTSFSASLLSALGGDTEKSAEIADMAITDMSDNANKMGTSMEMIQNAYNGFAKGNYTMLDNLKLGYGGTQKEMERLLSDAEKLSGQKYDMSNLNDVFQAIHVVQTELGITGTTAKEASTTISGSISSMKSAWKNLLAGMADENADMGQLTSNLTDSIQTVITNVAPAVKTAVSTLFDVAKEALPEAIGKIYETIHSLLPPEIQKALDIITDALKWIVDNKDAVIAGLAGIGAGLAVFNIVNTVMKLIEAFKLFKATQEGVTVAQWLLNTAMNANPIGIIIALIAGLVTAFVVLWNKSEAFRNFWINLWSVVKNACVTAWEGIKKFFTETIPKLIDNIVGWFGELPDKLKNIGKNLVEGLWNGIKDMTSWIKDKIKGFGESVVSGLKDFFGIHSPSKLMADEIGKFLPEGIAVGIDKNAKSVMNAMKDLTMNTLGATRNGLIEAGVTGGVTGGVVNNFYQTNNSPKALSRLEIYRQSKNLLGFAGGGV